MAVHGRESREWDRAAWIALHTILPYSKKKVTPADCNPYLAGRGKHGSPKSNVMIVDKSVIKNLLFPS